MNELIQALTRAAVAVAIYFEKTNGGEVAPAAEPKAKKTKKESEAPVPAAPASPAQPAAPEMTDKESYDELCRLAIGFIAADKPGTEERRAKAMSHVEATYKVSALSGVPHGPQRLQLIGWFKAQLGQSQAVASAPAGFGV